MFGKDSAVVKEGRIASTQTLSGTGALRVGFEFIANHVPGDAYVSNPSWGNHHPIIRRCGLNLLEYTYYDPKTRGFNFKGMIQDLKKA
jgi:aspartate/tyrosine/aromatic aminotransferase